MTDKSSPRLGQFTRRHMPPLFSWRNGGRALILLFGGAFLTSGLMGAPNHAVDAAAQPKPDPDYQKMCASCHGTTLRGGFGPALRGRGFTAKWIAAGEGALTAYIRANMPPGSPGTLAAATYPRLASHIFTVNGLKAVASAKTAAGVEPEAPKAPPAASSNEAGGLLPPEANYDAPYHAAQERRAQRLAALTPVTSAMLSQPSDGDWLQWRRTYDGFGHSPLKRINTANVGAMRVAWSLALQPGTNGIIPIAHDGVLFANSSGTVSAIDGASGEVLWTFSRPASTPTMGPPMTQARGMALYDRFLFVPTIDNHLIALDVRTGKVAWDHIIDSTTGTLRMTGAPMVVAEKVILGLSGCAGTGEPKGCFVAALDARTGAERWRFHTIAQPGESGGDSWNGAPSQERFGASLWSGGTYDAVNNLLLLGTGQTYHITPLMVPSPQPGTSNNALYTDSTLALDPGTGKLVWYYQHMARDVWDMDWGFERQVIDLDLPSGRRRVVVTMGKLGILDVLDAKTGDYLFSYDMGFQNLVRSINPRTGRKITDPALEPRNGEPVHICPHATGVRNFPSTSYDPDARLLYVPFVRSCMNLIWEKGADFDITGSLKAPEGNDRDFGGLAAIDIGRRREAWSVRQRAPSSSSALATAGGLVFYGARDRIFRADDSRTGANLWQLMLDGVPSATPISFEAGGAQYVAVVTGGGSPNEATVRSLTPEIETPGVGVRLWVFKLPDR